MSGRLPPTEGPPAVPLIGKSVPPGEAYLPEIPTIEKVLSFDFKEDFVRSLGQRIEKIPVAGKQIMEQVNPSALALDDSHKGIVAYQLLRDAGESSTSAAIAPLVELRTAFQVNAKGIVENVNIPKGNSPYIGDVLTFPDAYPLNVAQKQYADIANKLLDKSLSSQRKRHVNITPIQSFEDVAHFISLSVDHGRGRYFPRIPIGEVVKGKEVLFSHDPLKVSLGTKQVQAKPRSWPSQKQGVEKGNLVYMSDPTEVIRTTLLTARRAEADQMLAEFIKKQPGVETIVERMKRLRPEVVMKRELALFSERNRAKTERLLHNEVVGGINP